MSLLSRGRLIQKMVAIITRLDPAATDAVVDGGYDDDFDEILPVKDGTSLGADSRREMAELGLRCQLARSGGGFNRNELTRGGYQELTDIHVTLFMKDLEDAGLVDSNNVPVLKEGDRIDRVEDLNGNTLWKWAYPPGLMVKYVEPRGYGAAIVGTPKINLVTLHCHVPLEAGK